MVTKTREKLNNHMYPSEPPVHDVSPNEAKLHHLALLWFLYPSEDEKAMVFRVDGIDGLPSVVLYRNVNPELYDAFMNRKNIDLKLDEGKTYGPEDIKKLKKELLSDYDVPTESEYNSGYKKLSKAAYNCVHAIRMRQVANFLSSDLMYAYRNDKTGKKYDSVADYARNVFIAISKGEDYEEVKNHSHGLIGNVIDKISGKDHTLPFTKEALSQYFDKDDLIRLKDDFAKLAENIPSKQKIIALDNVPIENLPISESDREYMARFSSEVNALYKADACFRYVYAQKENTANQVLWGAFKDFANITAKREIAKAAEHTLEVKVKAHNDRIEKEQMKAVQQEVKKQKFAENAKRGKEVQKTANKTKHAANIEGTQKSAHGIRCGADINKTISARARKADLMK